MSLRRQNTSFLTNIDKWSVLAKSHFFFLGIETGPHAALIGCVHHGGIKSLMVTQLPPYAPDSGPGWDMTPTHMTGVEARTHVSTLAHEPLCKSQLPFLGLPASQVYAVTQLGVS